jgi:hypothetical protein
VLEAKETRPAEGGNETILVVEDQDAVRLFTTAALNERGYHVLELSNGDEAIAAHLNLVKPRQPGSTMRPDGIRAMSLRGYSCSTLAMPQASSASVPPWGTGRFDSNSAPAP